MVTVTVERTAKLMLPFGTGQGRVSEGTITANFGSARTVLAKDVGLRTITNMIVSAGTPLDIDAQAQVVSPGSVGNTARVRAFLRQSALVRFGTPRHHVYPVAFTGSPDLSLSMGSPAAAHNVPGTPPLYIQTQRPGSFKTRGSPTTTNGHYIAVGVGSFPINYTAYGD